MAGQTHTRLEVGDRCIIHVDDVNRPKGWWWGVVDSIEWNDDSHGGWGKVEVHITGPFAFKVTPGFPLGDSRSPMYGDDDRKPSVNYTVYGADRDTVALVRTIIGTRKHLEGKLREAEVRNAELRSVIQGMALTPEKIVAAVREAVEGPAGTPRA